ncbi:unnamed protein product [Mytilus edulis]|uniref:B box-type domain-containing protein n=1 Tax=Mytilus edulis TaxID=6550 RepID=A0A8S3RCB8_MYTED|nr:unnamed protein product [Mytilus edulis]
MQKNNSNIKAKKDELNKLMSAENSKYSKVRQDIVSHEKTVKEQVEKYFKELINKLDHSHTTVLKLVKSDLNAISIFSNQTEDKINQVQDFIGISNATDFFKEVNMMQKCTEIQEPKIKPIYGFSKKIVPGNITQLNIGSLQDDGNLSAETNISLVINNEYQTELGIIALIISREEIGLHREELDFTNIKCDEHAGQSSCLYCNTCDVLVCPTCIAKVHKKHDLIEISDAYKLKVEGLKRGQSKMQKSNSNMKAKR